MVTIAIYSRNSATNSRKVVESIISNIRNHNGLVMLYEPYYHHFSQYFNAQNIHELFTNYDDIVNKVDFLISVGGDGSLLDTIHLVRDSNIPIFGINIGKLGFLSSIGTDEIEKSIACLLSGNYKISERTLLNTSYTGQNDSIESLFALNDITVSKKDTNSMITIHTYVNKIHLNSYWSDGLIISTPTGSTAYSLSCLGPILTPDSENFIINPIAPHNLSTRPVIVPDSSEIQLIVEGRQKHFFLTTDSKTLSVKTGTELHISKEKFSIRLIKFLEDNFFQLIRDKLHWGSDRRN
jgi:NAD+ kinase